MMLQDIISCNQVINRLSFGIKEEEIRENYVE